MAEQTRIHLVRHGEVYNPDGVLYGRLPGFKLSDKGIRQAQAVADALADRDVVAVIASRCSARRRPPHRSPPATTCRSTPIRT